MYVVAFIYNIELVAEIVSGIVDTTLLDAICIHVKTWKNVDNDMLQPSTSSISSFYNHAIFSAVSLLASKHLPQAYISSSNWACFRLKAHHNEC